MPYQIRARWFAPLLLLSLLAGCAGTPPAPTFKPPVYPAPPDQARYIYERTLRVNEDVEQLSGFARWRELATGHNEEWCTTKTAANAAPSATTPNGVIRWTSQKTPTAPVSTSWTSAGWTAMN